MKLPENKKLISIIEVEGFCEGKSYDEKYDYIISACLNADLVDDKEDLTNPQKAKKVKMQAHIYVLED
jgi:hypothetical protein